MKVGDPVLVLSVIDHADARFVGRRGIVADKTASAIVVKFPYRFSKKKAPSIRLAHHQIREITVLDELAEL
jgi:hypothetical protein